MTRLSPRPMLIALSLAAVAACGQPAPAPAPPPPPAGPRLYVTDEPGGQVVVVDIGTGQVLDHIAVGKRPRGIHIARDGKQLLVALSGSPIAGPGVDESKLPPPDRSADGIGIVDLASHKVLKVLTGGQDPESFDISPDGTQVYVSNEETSEMSVIEISSGTIVQRVKIGDEPEGVTVRPDGKVVYVTCEGSNAVYAIDLATYKVIGKVATGARPRSVVFTADSKIGFAGGETAGTVTVFDATKHTVLSTIKIEGPAGAPVAPRPMGLVMSPDGATLFTSNGRAKSVGVIDLATRKFVKTYEDVGQRPWGIALSADGKTLYTANGPSGDVSVVDAATGAVQKKIAVGGGPWGVAIGK